MVVVSTAASTRTVAVTAIYPVIIRTTRIATVVIIATIARITTNADRNTASSIFSVASSLATIS